MKFYSGEFKNDVKHGYGVFYKRNTKIHYQGFVTNNFFNGYGVKYNDKSEEIYKGNFKNGTFIFADDLTWNEKANIYNFLSNAGNSVAMYLSQTEIEIKLLCWKNKVNRKHFEDMSKKYQKNYTSNNYTSNSSPEKQAVVTPEIVRQYVNEYLYKYYNIPFQSPMKNNQIKKTKMNRQLKPKSVERKSLGPTDNSFDDHEIPKNIRFNIKSNLKSSHSDTDRSFSEKKPTEQMLSDLMKLVSSRNKMEKDDIPNVANYAPNYERSIDSSESQDNDASLEPADKILAEVRKALESNFQTFNNKD